MARAGRLPLTQDGAENSPDQRAENEKGMETMSEVYRAKGERLDLSEGDAE